MTDPFDLHKLRSEFPILRREVKPGVPLVYLDSTATSQKPVPVIEAMDSYDREGLHRGSQVFRQIDSHLQRAGATQAARFEDHARVLELFACGLSGRRLKLDVAAEPYTDTETLYLPPRIAAFPTHTENFNLYKLLIALLWAQARYGTFHADVAAACAAYADPARAAALLGHLETLRLETRIAATLPGIARDLARLRGTPPDPRCAPLAAAGYTFTGTDTSAKRKLPLQMGRAPLIERVRRSSDLGRRRAGAFFRAAAAVFGLLTGLFAISYRLGGVSLSGTPLH